MKANKGLLLSALLLGLTVPGVRAEKNILDDEENLVEETTRSVRGENEGWSKTKKALFATAIVAGVAAGYGVINHYMKKGSKYKSDKVDGVYTGAVDGLSTGVTTVKDGVNAAVGKYWSKEEQEDEVVEGPESKKDPKALPGSVELNEFGSDKEEITEKEEVPQT